MSNKKLDFSVVIPAYNEATNIENSIDVIFDLLASSPVGNFELILVNDGSSDNTDELILSISKKKKYKNRVSAVSYFPNQGKGWALKTGFEASVGKFVAFYDADLEIPPKLLPTYLETIKKEKADAIVGSKRHPESILEYSKVRKIISNVYYIFNRIFFGLKVKDTQSGIKIFKRDLLEKIVPTLLVKRFAFDLELLVNVVRLGGKIIEAPIEIQNHETYGTIGLKALWYSFADTMAVLYRIRLLKYYNWIYMLPPAKTKKTFFNIIIEVKSYSKYLDNLVTQYKNVDYPDDLYQIIILAQNDGFKIEGATVVESANLGFRDRYNLVMKEVKSGIVVLTTPYLQPARNWLNIGNHYFSKKEIDGVIGPVRYNGTSFSEKVAGWLKKHPMVMGKNYIYYHIRRQRMVSKVVLNNLFLRKKVFVSLLKSDVTAQMSCGDESLWDLKGVKGRSNVVYCPDLLVESTTETFSLFWEKMKAEAKVAGFVCAHSERCSHRVDFYSLYFLQAFFFLAVVSGTVFSFFSPFFRTAFLLTLFSYFLVLATLSGRFINVAKLFFTSFLVIGHQLQAGFSFLKGLFKRKI